MSERRSFDGRGLRLVVQRSEGQPATIRGYGAVFYRAGDPGTEYQLLSDLYERIAPGAFDRAIREDDVRSFFNHDANIVLGRNRAGTLKLSVDERGLIFEATPPDTQLVRDQVLAPLSRGDVSGASFMFDVLRQTWTEEQRGDRLVEIRTIEEVALHEVGPVVFPAYEAATSGARDSRPSGPADACGVKREEQTILRASASDTERSALEAARQQRRLERAAECEAVSVRVRQLELEEDACAGPIGPGD